MHKPWWIVILVVIVQACSIFPTQTSEAVQAATATMVPLKTATASITPTITPSPTIVRFPTQDPSLQTETPLPLIIFTAVNTITPVPTMTSSLPGAGFQSVTISEGKIFWGSCVPRKSKVTAQVSEPDKVVSVVIFVQVKSAKEEDYTPWTTGDVMFDHGDGTFTYDLQANEIDGHNHYKNSWVRFQLVATDALGGEIGRTRIYAQDVALSPCMCLEPLKGCPILTPTKPKP